MLRRLLRLSVFSSCLIFVGTAPTQVPAIPAPTLPGTSTTTPPATQAAPATLPDPLGRSNPRSTMRELIRVLDREDYVSATRYLQLSKEQQHNAQRLEQDLRELLNCCFEQPLATISDSENGALDDGLPLDQERIGPLKIGSRRADIILVHVSRPEGNIWLVSSLTLEEIPALHALITESRVERFMPQTLQRGHLLGLSIAHWVVWLGSLLIPLLCFWLLDFAVIFVIKRSVTIADKRNFLVRFANRIKWPVTLILAIVTHLLLLPQLGFPLRFRIIDQHAAAIALIILITSALRRSITLISDRTRAQLLSLDRRNSASMLLLGERLFRVLLVIAAGFAMLSAAGVDTKTALTGLGIGGIAIAFGAQKTIENLLGGILLISDKAIAVGDFCSISDRVGTIEDITLRSVRMRTVEQTLLLIPAGILSQANIENFRSRTKMPLVATIRLQYSATVAQVSAVRDQIYSLLLNDPRIEGSSARVSVTDFAQWAIELQLWTYLLTADIQKFNSIRQELLLQIAQIVESAGCKLAIPSQMIFSRQES